MGEIQAGYARHSNGQWYVQVPDPKAKFGFVLCDDDQSYDAIPGTWDLVPEADVPADVIDRLSRVLDEMK